MKTSHIGYRKVLRTVVLLLSILAYLPAPPSFAISNDQVLVMQRGIMDFNVDVGASASCGGSGSTTTLIGKDNPTKVWNFFKGQGLDDMHVAAIMGNFEQESSFSPTVMQIGGNSNDPRAAGGGGWGLAQWTPGATILTAAAKYNITTPIYELPTQLTIVWKQMNDVSPAGATDMIKDFKNTTSLEQATSNFTTNFEAAGVIGPRLSDAQQALATYGGTGGGSTGATGGSCNYLPPDCTSASGVAKILCDAKAYDPVSYLEAVAGGHQGGAAWHATCPTINASCYLDCSGLVNIAVYDVFGVDLRENVQSMYDDSKNWQHISFNQAVPGDLLLPTGTTHVEIIDHIQGNTIYTFGSHNSHLPQPDQVGPASFQYQTTYTFLHYIGSGS